MRLLLCMLALAAVVLAPTATADPEPQPATHCSPIVYTGGDPPNIDLHPECLPPHCHPIVIGGGNIDIRPECL